MNGQRILDHYGNHRKPVAGFPTQECAASLELAGRHTNPETRSALPGTRTWPHFCRFQTGSTLGAFGEEIASLGGSWNLSPQQGEGLRVRGGATHDSVSPPMRLVVIIPPDKTERRFVTGFARPNALSRLETGAPPRFRGAHRKHSFVESLPYPPPRLERRALLGRTDAVIFQAGQCSALQSRGTNPACCRFATGSSRCAPTASSKLAARCRGKRNHAEFLHS